MGWGTLKSSKTGRETLEVVGTGWGNLGMSGTAWGTLGEINDGLGDPLGGPERVDGPLETSGMG